MYIEYCCIRTILAWYRPSAATDHMRPLIPKLTMSNTLSQLPRPAIVSPCSHPSARYAKRYLITPGRDWRLQLRGEGPASLCLTFSVHGVNLLSKVLGCFVPMQHIRSRSGFFGGRCLPLQLQGRRYQGIWEGIHHEMHAFNRLESDHEVSGRPHYSQSLGKT